MAGTWESQNKVLPGAYINIRTNEPLSITPGDRGIVVILQEMSAGADGAVYTITATEAAWPDGVTAIDKKLAAEALKASSPSIRLAMDSSSRLAMLPTTLPKLSTRESTVASSSFFKPPVESLLLPQAVIARTHTPIRIKPINFFHVCFI